jgi:two-component system chemotaxis response regulator CheB
MARREIIVIGGSAGSTGALRALVAGLPADFPGSIFIATPMPSDDPRLLGELLQAPKARGRK